MRSPPNSEDGATEAAPDDAIDTREVARLLGMALISVAQQRARGEGPPFFRVGKRHIRYIRRDVLAYREARKVGKAP